MEDIRIGFIGLGLIGGSIAKSIKSVYPFVRLCAWNHRISSIEPALKEGLLDEIISDDFAGFRDCDVIFLCAPVEQNVYYLEKLRPLIKEGCIITDVGSTKTLIMEKARELQLDRHFIGGHPMAGSEKSGYAHSNDHLLENAYYILTPFPETPSGSFSLLQELVKACGSICVTLSYKEHDYVTAAISHVPHVIASGLVNLVQGLDSKQEWMKRLAAGGFKDITRIASSSPAVWQEICSANAENIHSVLQKYIELLLQIDRSICLDEKSRIHDYFDTAKIYRNSLPTLGKGSIPREYALYCDIRDEYGAIAAIATQLSLGQISIKNIGIVHNRESEEGVLRVEFYDQPSQIQAEQILKKYGRTVIRRD